MKHKIYDYFHNASLPSIVINLISPIICIYPALKNDISMNRTFSILIDITVMIIAIIVATIRFWHFVKKP